MLNIAHVLLEHVHPSSSNSSSSSFSLQTKPHCNRFPCGFLVVTCEDGCPASQMNRQGRGVHLAPPANRAPVTSSCVSLQHRVAAVVVACPSTSLRRQCPRSCPVLDFCHTICEWERWYWINSQPSNWNGFEAAEHSLFLKRFSCGHLRLVSFIFSRKRAARLELAPSSVGDLSSHVVHWF